LTQTTRSGLAYSSQMSGETTKAHTEVKVKSDWLVLHSPKFFRLALNALEQMKADEFGTNDSALISIVFAAATCARPNQRKAAYSARPRIATASYEPFLWVKKGKQRAGNPRGESRLRQTGHESPVMKCQRDLRGCYCTSFSF